jgi:hypothetical protein
MRAPSGSRDRHHFWFWFSYSTTVLIPYGAAPIYSQDSVGQYRRGDRRAPGAESFYTTYSIRHVYAAPARRCRSQHLPAAPQRHTRLDNSVRVLLFFISARERLLSLESTEYFWFLPSSACSCRRKKHRATTKYYFIYSYHDYDGTSTSTHRELAWFSARVNDTCDMRHVIPPFILFACPLRPHPIQRHTSGSWDPPSSLCMGGYAPSLERVVRHR